VQMRPYAHDAGHREDLRLESLGCVGVRNIAVQGRHVSVHGHVNPRLVEGVLEWSDARTNAIGEHEVIDVFVGMPATNPVPESLRTSLEMVHTADEQMAAPTGGVSAATDADVQRGADGGARRECVDPNHGVPPFPG